MNSKEEAVWRYVEEKIISFRTAMLYTMFDAVMLLRGWK